MTVAQQARNQKAKAAPLSLEQLKQRGLEAYQNSRQSGISSKARLDWQEQAVDWAAELIEQQQTAEGLHLLARVRMDQGHLAQAMAQLHQSLLVSQNNAEAYFSLGHCYLLQGHLEQALNAFAHSWEMDSEASHADAAIGYTLLEMGRPEQAFGVLKNIIVKREHDPLLQQRFLQCLALVKPDQVKPEWLQLASLCLSFDQQDLQPAEAFISHLLFMQYECQWNWAQISQDSLLIETLERVLICHPGLELSLRSVRRELLLQAVAENQIADHLIPLVSSIAEQCRINEGIWSASPEEHKILEQLSEVWQVSLDSNTVQGHDLSSIVLLLAMYKPLGLDIKLDQLVLKQPYAPWLERLIQPIVKQQHWTKRATRRSKLILNNQLSSQDGVSIEVQKQYEQWPYPRWQQLPQHEPGHLYETLQRTFCNYKPSQCLLQDHIPVLVAGCGTGLHAINLAKNFYHTQVTAIDLSASSLSYGAAKAEQFGIDNILWQQANLLHLPSQIKEQRFALIECSGVLHHLGNPLAGLQALKPLLQPGGLIKLAVYSHKARTAVRHLRQELSKYSKECNLNLMQQVRDMLIADADNPAWQGLIGGYDFSSASGLKDLLFHECEHQFSPSEIQTQLLDPCQLEVVGLVTTKAMQRSFYRTFGKDAPINDLGLWQRLEAFEPLIFAGMIQLYARAKG